MIRKTTIRKHVSLRVPAANKHSKLTTYYEGLSTLTVSDKHSNIESEKK